MGRKADRWETAISYAVGATQGTVVPLDVCVRRIKSLRLQMSALQKSAALGPVIATEILPPGLSDEAGTVRVQNRFADGSSSVVSARVPADLRVNQGWHDLSMLRIQTALGHLDEIHQAVYNRRGSEWKTGCGRAITKDMLVTVGRLDLVSCLYCKDKDE